MERVVIGGFLSKVELTVHNGQVNIQSTDKGKFDANIEDITTLFVKDLDFISGYVYFSIDGDIDNDPKSKPNTVVYKDKHENSVKRIIDIVLTENPSIDVVHVTREFDIDNDPAVIDYRGPLKCPNCKSINLDFMGNQRKSFSVGKAVAGGLLTGGVGAVAGFAGKKGDDRWRCRDCGHIFNTKPKK